MAIDQNLIQRWCEKPLKKKVLEVRDEILTAEDFTQPSRDVFGFILLLILSCKPDVGNRILGKVFQVPEIAVVTVWPDERLTLELFWSTFSGRPDNTPWERDDDLLKEAKTRGDPKNVEFYETWTKTDWISNMLMISIGPDYNAHQWKESQDPWTHVICARILCQAHSGIPPAEEKIEEAFEAVDKIFMTLPLPSETPPKIIFSWQIYFALALHLNHPEKARKTLQLASQREEFDIHNFLDIPALYETLAASIDDPPIRFLDDSELKEVEDELLAALTTRIEQGRKAPLHDVLMPELLRRFSEAAFFVYKEEYLRNDINSPEAVLCEPLTADEVTSFEEQLGLLPPDHFAGGGWSGIHELSKEPATEYEVYLGYEPEPVSTVETRTRADGSTYEVVVHVITHGRGQKAGRDWGDVYVGNGLTECDNFLHVLCPPVVWKKIQEAGGKMVKEGEYAFVYYADWTAGGDIHHSLRDWVGVMTMELERCVAVGYKEEPPRFE